MSQTMGKTKPEEIERLLRQNRQRRTANLRRALVAAALALLTALLSYYGIDVELGAPPPIPIPTVGTRPATPTPAPTTIKE